MSGYPGILFFLHSAILNTARFITVSESDTQSMCHITAVIGRSFMFYRIKIRNRSDGYTYTRVINAFDRDDAIYKTKSLPDYDNVDEIISIAREAKVVKK